MTLWSETQSETGPCLAEASGWWVLDRERVTWVLLCK